jgi:hypothetical protein
VGDLLSPRFERGVFFALPTRNSGSICAESLPQAGVFPGSGNSDKRTRMPCGLFRCLCPRPGFGSRNKVPHPRESYDARA